LNEVSLVYDRLGSISFNIFKLWIFIAIRNMILLIEQLLFLYPISWNLLRLFNKYSNARNKKEVPVVA